MGFGVAVLCAAKPKDAPKTVDTETVAAADEAESESSGATDPQAALKDYLRHDILFVASPEIEAYLTTVIDKLLQTNSSHIAIARPKLLIYSEGEFSAAADENDYLLVSTQTLRMLESEDELAALLAHELAHVVHKHAQKKKAFTRSFPGGIEAMGELAAAADQAKVARQQPAAADQLSEFAQDSLRTSQNASLFWTDLLATNWNKKQERQADRSGFDMMRAAGYDSAAFATLFSKLHAAQLKRSERMEALRKVIVARAQEQQKAAASNDASAELGNVVTSMRNMASEKAINAFFDALAKVSMDYDSPEQRQELLAKYAAETPQPRRDKAARSPRFQQILGAGAGGALLKADDGAIRTVSALKTGDLKAAQEAIAPLLPKKVDAKVAQGKNKPKAKGKSKDKDQAPAQIVPAASPHLNLAFSQWYVAQGDLRLGEEQAKAWLASQQAPARAFSWRAAFQAARNEYVQAGETLEAGARHIDNPAPFLPDMVTLARLAQDEPRAETYTRRCNEEDNKNMGVARRLTSFVKSNATPTGLYAKCIQRLGRIPADANGTANGLVATPAAKSTTPLENLRNKLNGDQ